MALSKEAIKSIIELKIKDEDKRAKGGKKTTNQQIAEMFDTSERSVRRIYKKFKKEGSYRGVDLKYKITFLGNEGSYNKGFSPTKEGIFSITTSSSVGSDVTQLMIPDTQCKDGIDMSYLTAIGLMIVDVKPDVIVHIGDHADMPSLSSYDKGKGAAEGKRVQKDIDAAIKGMNLLLEPLYQLQQEQLRNDGYISYKPKMCLTLGNHEQRIVRHVDENPELIGFLSYDNLRYKEMGWEVSDFLKPITVNGVVYSHYMANPMSGRPYGGQALNVLKQVGESFCVGHKQTLDIATRFLPASGIQQWGIVAGACYTHDEGYKGYQGNHHFRGLVLKHHVMNGTFDPEFISLSHIMNKYL